MCPVHAHTHAPSAGTCGCSQDHPLTLPLSQTQAPGALHSPPRGPAGSQVAQPMSRPPRPTQLPARTYVLRCAGPHPPPAAGSLGQRVTWMPADAPARGTPATAGQCPRAAGHAPRASEGRTLGLPEAQKGCWGRDLPHAGLPWPGCGRGPMAGAWQGLGAVRGPQGVGWPGRRQALPLS